MRLKPAYGVSPVNASLILFAETTASATDIGRSLVADVVISGQSGLLFLTRFLHANQCPLRAKTLRNRV